MRLRKPFLSALILLLMFGASPSVRAQIRGAPSDRAQTREALVDQEIASLAQGKAQGDENEQAQALFRLTHLFMPYPEQGTPLFRAHLQRLTKTLAEAQAIRYAAEGLARYGTKAQSALPELIRLQEEAGTAQSEATYGGQFWGAVTTALSRIGPDDPAVVEVLKRTLRRCLDNPKQREALLAGTATALSHMGHAAHSAVPLLTTALNRAPAGTTPQLAIALGQMMPEAGIAIPALIRALEAGRSPNAVMAALGDMGPAAKSALPALHRALTLPSPQTACNAFAAIACIEGQPTLTVPESLAILKQIDQHTLPEQYAAFATLKRQNLLIATLTPILAPIVESRKEQWLRRTAVEMFLTSEQVEAREVALVLIRAAQRQDPVIMMDVEKTFEKFASIAPQVTPELSSLLMTDNVRLRGSIQILLYSIGRDAAPAVPNLIRLLRDEARGKRFADSAAVILRMLSRIGPDAQEAAPFLTDLLLKAEKDSTGAPVYDRTALLSALTAIGLTPRVLPVVQSMLQSAQPTEVGCAAHAVALLGPQATETLPLLLRPLRADYKDESMTADFSVGSASDFSETNGLETSAQIEIMRALARLGPAAGEALPLLQSSIASSANEPAHTFREYVLKEEAKRAILAIQRTKETH